MIEIRKTYYDDIGQLNIEDPFKNGKRHGTLRKWRRSGELIYEAQYVDGKRYGLYREWYICGALHYETSRANDEYHGEYRRWESDGTLVYTNYYLYGVVVSEDEYRTHTDGAVGGNLKQEQYNGIT